MRKTKTLKSIPIKSDRDLIISSLSGLNKRQIKILLILIGFLTGKKAFKESISFSRVDNTDHIDVKTTEENRV